MSTPPTLMEWLGGTEALRRLMTTFYARAVHDPALAPLFGHLGPEHAEHVTRFIDEVFGGPPRYSEEHGGHLAMLRHHVGKQLTEAQRQRWLWLLLTCADEVGLPDDPEFRSALVGYLEWGSRLAVINSHLEAAPSEPGPMPRWGWGEVKGPYRPE